MKSYKKVSYRGNFYEMTQVKIFFNYSFPNNLYTSETVKKKGELH